MGDQGNAQPPRFYLLDPIFLFQEADRHRVTIGLPIAGSDCCKNCTDKPDDQKNRQDEKSDQDPAESPGNQEVETEGDLKVQHLLAGGIDLWVVGPLDQPNGEGDKDMSQSES